MIASARKRSIIDRMLGAALLEPDTYEEAALSRSVQAHAAMVVIITSVAAGVGTLSGGLTAFVLGAFFGLVGWGVYAFAAYWTAINQYGVPRNRRTMGGTLRVLGLAASPRVLLIFALVPAIGFLIGLAVFAWVLITTVFALRLALDLDTRPAIGAGLAGWFPMLLLWVLVRLLT